MSRTIKLKPKLVADAKEAASKRNEAAMLSAQIGAQFMGLVARTVEVSNDFKAAGERLKEAEQAIYETYGIKEADIEKLDLNEAILIVKAG